MSRGRSTLAAEGGRPRALVATGTGRSPPTTNVMTMFWRKLPSLCSVAVSVEAPSCRGEISKRALLLDLPARGMRSGRTLSAILKSALSSWTVTSTSSTPAGKSDASAKGAVVSDSAR